MVLTLVWRGRSGRVMCGERAQNQTAGSQKPAEEKFPTNPLGFPRLPWAQSAWREALPGIVGVSLFQQRLAANQLRIWHVLGNECGLFQATAGCANDVLEHRDLQGPAACMHRRIQNATNREKEDGR